MHVFAVSPGPRWGNRGGRDGTRDIHIRGPPQMFWPIGDRINGVPLYVFKSPVISVICCIWPDKTCKCYRSVLALQRDLSVWWLQRTYSFSYFFSCYSQLATYELKVKEAHVTMAGQASKHNIESSFMTFFVLIAWCTASKAVLPSHCPAISNDPLMREQIIHDFFGLITEWRKLSWRNYALRSKDTH